MANYDITNTTGPSVAPYDVNHLIGNTTTPYITFTSNAIDDSVQGIWNPTEYPIQPGGITTEISVVNGWLTGRRPPYGLQFPRGYYNK